MSMRRASPAQREELQRWFSIRTTDILSCQQKIDAVTRLYTELDMPRICKEQEDKCYCLAHGYLDKVEVCEDKKNVLREYLAGMMNRKA